MSVRTLPPNPSLEQLKKRAKDLLKAYRSGKAEALARFRASVSRLATASDAEIQGAQFALLDAQGVIAGEYGFDSWTALAAQVEQRSQGYSVDDQYRFFVAVIDLDVEGVRQALDAAPAVVDGRIKDDDELLKSAALRQAIADDQYPRQDESLTALHQVSRMPFSRLPSARLEIAQLLIDRGADVNSIGFDGNNGVCTSIVLAAWEGGEKMMRLLLDNGADVSGQYGVAALRYTGAFEVLEEYGAPISPWSLIELGFIDRVVELVERDPGLLSQRGEKGYTIIQAAAWHTNRHGRKVRPNAARERLAHGRKMGRSHTRLFRGRERGLRGADDAAQSRRRPQRWVR